MSTAHAIADNASENYVDAITTCAVCGGGNDEDVILICDGENCKNEVHM